MWPLGVLLWSWSFWFSLYPVNKVSLLNDATTDLWPWNSFIMVIKCTNLYDRKLMVQSLSCLQDFNSNWCYDLDFLPLSSKNYRVLPLIMVIKYTNLYVPKAYCLVFILPTRFFYKVMLQPWPLILKNNRVLPFIMVIQLYDTEAYSSVSILPTRSRQMDDAIP
jgi:hypothetical protein